jgi:hypothetical protein
MISTRKTAVLVTVIGVLMLAVGLTVGLEIDGHTPQAHAAGSGGGIDMFPDGSLVACTSSIGCTQHPAGTCITDGTSNAVRCSFTLDSHSGGVIQADNVAECFFIQPDGSYFTSFDSHIVYAPSGQVNIRCAR